LRWPESFWIAPANFHAVLFNSVFDYLSYKKMKINRLSVDRIRLRSRIPLYLVGGTIAFHLISPSADFAPDRGQNHAQLGICLTNNAILK